MDSIKKRSGFAAPFSFEFEYALLQPVFFRFRVPEIIGLAVDACGILRVADHPHPAGMVMGPKILHDGFQRHGSRLGHGISVDPGGDGGKVHRINAVCPGPIEGERIGDILKWHADAEHIDQEVLYKDWENVPMKRFMKPGEVSAAMKFLCSDSASAMTGQALNVTGGFIMS